MAEPVDFWYDQLARDRRRRFGPKAAFETFRNLLEGSGVDPYREPMFDRVWCATPGRDDPPDTTIFGFDFADTSAVGSLHHALKDEGRWEDARRRLLDALSDGLLDRVEAARNPWHDFVAFAEAFTSAAAGAAIALQDWQRRFAEAVESGSVPVSFANAGGPEGKKWQADVLAAFHEARGTPEGSEPPDESLAGLRQMFDEVQVAEAKQLDYVVIDPSVLPGNHVEGRDGIGKLYLRVPPTAIDRWVLHPTGLGQALLGQALGTVWGIKVYRREDLPKNWPDPLPDAVSSSP